MVAIKCVLCRRQELGGGLGIDACHRDHLQALGSGWFGDSVVSLEVFLSYFCLSLALFCS